MVKEPPRTNKRGRKRIAKGEVAKSIFGGYCNARLEGIAWRKLGKERNYHGVTF